MEIERRQRIAFTVAALVALTTGACGTSRTAPGVAPGDPAVGAYETISVNGIAVPGRIVNNQGMTLEFLEGSFVIRADGTCSSRSVFVMPWGEEVVREVDATWTREGGTLTMRWVGAGVTTAQVEGDTLTMDNVGMILAYRRLTRS